MKLINTEEIFKKREQDQARMDQLGITENEMTTFHNSCGSEGQVWDKAFAALKERFRLDTADATFVEKVLGDCGPF